MARTIRVKVLDCLDYPPYHGRYNGCQPSKKWHWMEFPNVEALYRYISSDQHTYSKKYTEDGVIRRKIRHYLAQNLCEVLTLDEYRAYFNKCFKSSRQNDPRNDEWVESIWKKWKEDWKNFHRGREK